MNVCFFNKLRKYIRIGAIQGQRLNIGSRFAVRKKSIKMEFTTEERLLFTRRHM